MEHELRKVYKIRWEKTRTDSPTWDEDPPVERRRPRPPSFAPSPDSGNEEELPEAEPPASNPPVNRRRSDRGGRVLTKKLRYCTPHCSTLVRSLLCSSVAQAKLREMIQVEAVT